MAKLIWDQVGERIYETGVKNGVLYIIDNTGEYGIGIPWNGLVTVTESPTGAEPTPIYADDMKYLNILSAEEFAATIEAYTYPDEFAQCDGSASLGNGIFIGQQARKSFGFVYKTSVGNDIVNNDYGYKLHIIYGCLAAPSEKAYGTINDSPEAITFSWEISTTPLNVSNFKPTASIVIDSTIVDSSILKNIEDVLFGSTSSEAKILLPDEIQEMLSTASPTILINETNPTIAAGGGTTTLTVSTTNMPTGATVEWSVSGSGWTVVNGLVTAPSSVANGDNETVTASIIASDTITVLGTPATVVVNIT